MPSSVTPASDATDWSTPASAVGAVLTGGLTVISTSSASEVLALLSVTSSAKVSVSAASATVRVGAVKDGWDQILVHQLDSRHRPCNFEELMPRLRER